MTAELHKKIHGRERRRFVQSLFPLVLKWSDWTCSSSCASLDRAMSSLKLPAAYNEIATSTKNVVDMRRNKNQATL